MTRNKDSDSDEAIYKSDALYQGVDGEIRPAYYEKPNLSYSTLIAQAISDSPENKLSLKQIYEWIMTRYPFFENQKGNWQNSIRHNLSLNKAFFKIPRSQNNPGKGCYWCLDKELYMVSNKIKNRRVRRSTKGTPDSHNFEGRGGMSSVREILEQSDAKIDSLQKNKPFKKSGETISFNGDLHNPNLFFDNSPQHDFPANNDSFYSEEMFKFE